MALGVLFRSREDTDNVAHGFSILHELFVRVARR